MVAEADEQYAAAHDAERRKDNPPRDLQQEVTQASNHIQKLVTVSHLQHQEVTQRSDQTQKRVTVDHLQLQVPCRLPEDGFKRQTQEDQTFPPGFRV